MEALAEQHVARYLTQGGKVFIAPQYPVPGDKPDGQWSWPDFVALDFERSDAPEVVVVEVTTAWDISTLIKKVKDRKGQWFTRTHDKLVADGVIRPDWKIRFLGFIRRDNLKKVADIVAEEDVAFVAIEDVTFSWEYWDFRKERLPR